MSRFYKLFYFLLIAIIALSCASNGGINKTKGELVGVKGKKYYPEKPYGMVLIPGGSFIMGKSDDDLAAIEDAPTKTVSVRSFYMDETEITNSEYRQFVNWVRDSIVRLELAKRAEEVIQSDSENLDSTDGIRQYAFIDTDTTDLSVYDKWSLENDFSNSDEEYYSKRKLNWDVDLIYDRSDYPDEDYLEVIESFFLKKDEVFNNVRTWDVKKFTYEFVESRIDEYFTDREVLINDLVESLYNDDGIDVSPSEIDDEMLAIEYENFKKSNYIIRESIQVYPDTTVWIKDFKYSYNYPMHNDYFWHDAYSDYPVVGVTWKQAKAFCDWRTMTKNSYQKTKKRKSLVPDYRLPTEAEWEYAARGGLQGSMYPWGGPYTKNDRGCFMANFKPMRGDYAVDQAMYTVEANSYDPNGYNLYNMSGNVSEWVDSSYESEAYDFSISMNPNVNLRQNKKKVIRGGSWKDVKYFLQVSSRDYEYEDQPRSYIGFRTVHDYLGTDLNANAMTNSSIRKENNKRSSIK